MKYTRTLELELLVAAWDNYKKNWIVPECSDCGDGSTRNEYEETLKGLGWSGPNFNDENLSPFEVNSMTPAEIHMDKAIIKLLDETDDVLRRQNDAEAALCEEFLAYDQGPHKTCDQEEGM